VTEQQYPADQNAGAPPPPPVQYRSGTAPPYPAQREAVSEAMPRVRTPADMVMSENRRPPYNDRMVGGPMPMSIPLCQLADGANGTVTDLLRLATEIRMRLGVPIQPSNPSPNTLLAKNGDVNLTTMLSMVCQHAEELRCDLQAILQHLS
jgi:hypothetical protein